MYVRAAQEQQALGGDAHVVGQGPAVSEPGSGGGHVKPAVGVDDMQRQHARGPSQQGSSAEGQVIPLRRQCLTACDRRLDDPYRAYSREGQHPDKDHQRVRHHRPAEDYPRHDRDIPAGAGTIQDQPDRHHRHGSADVVR